MLRSIYYFCIASGGKYSHWATGIKDWSSREVGSHPSYPAVFNSNTSHLLLFIIPGLDKTGLIFQSLQAFLEKTQINVFLPLLPLQENIKANSWHSEDLTYRSHSHPEAGQLPLLSQHGDNGPKWNRNNINYRNLCQHRLLTPLAPTDFNCLVFILGWRWTQEVWVVVNEQTDSWNTLSNGFSIFTHFQLPFQQPVCWQSIWIAFLFFIWRSHCLSIWLCFLTSTFSRWGLTSHSFYNPLSCHRLLLHSDLSN